jgi:hypothetical protein
MSTIFPLSASVGQIFDGYQFNGTTWDIIGIDLTANYPEILEGKISASVIPDIFATNEYVDGSAISASAAAVTYLVDSAPETLNTLNELSAALNDDANFASTITTALGNKLDISSASSTYLTQASASVTYAPIVPSTQTGFRNILINGDMRIDQRNNGGNQSVLGGGAVYTYGVDRWFGYLSGGPGLMTQIFASGLYYVKLFTNSLSNAILGQRIEARNSAHLAGQTVTLSFRMASDTTSTVTWAVSYANTTDTFGTQASPTITAITSGTVNTTSSLTNYSVTFAVPTAATTGLQILFTTPTEIGVSLSLTNVQLELGSSATPFEQRPIGTELALCQRYYWRWVTNGNTFAYYSMCMMRLNTVFVLGTGPKHPVTMRAVPSVFFNSMFGEVPAGGGKSLTNGLVQNNLSTVENVGFVVNADSNWGAAEPGLIRANATNAAYVEHSAEL